jgi:hypothetical protein
MTNTPAEAPAPDERPTSLHCACCVANDAELQRLRAALEEIEYLDRPQIRGLPRRVSIQDIARAALKEDRP